MKSTVLASKSLRTVFLVAWVGMSGNVHAEEISVQVAETSSEAGKAGGPVINEGQVKPESAPRAIDEERTLKERGPEANEVESGELVVSQVDLKSGKDVSTNSEDLREPSEEPTRHTEAIVDETSTPTPEEGTTTTEKKAIGSLPVEARVNNTSTLITRTRKLRLIPRLGYAAGGWSYLQSTCETTGDLTCEDIEGADHSEASGILLNLDTLVQLTNQLRMGGSA